LKDTCARPVISIQLKRFRRALPNGMALAFGNGERNKHNENQDERKSGKGILQRLFFYSLRG
jgi:hypothetical protein